MTAEANEPQEQSDSAEERLQKIEQQLQEKEAQLQERDRTVQELTDRLAQTAEKLDRVKRSGSEHAVVKTASFPKQVVEQQTELVDDLQRAVQMWEGMQMSCSLGRLEMQVSDLHALFDEHFREEEPEPTEPEEAEAVEADGSVGAEESSCEGSNEEVDGESDSETDLESDGAESSEDEGPLPDLEEMCPLRPPEILHLHEAKVEDLKRCVEQQDAYIDYLSARLQRATEKKNAVDWDELAQDPEKIARQLEHSATKIRQSQYFTEFELALQQTRLKRKERKLKELTTELESEMQQVKPTERDAIQEETPGGQRWLRMLGVGKKGNE